VTAPLVYVASPLGFTEPTRDWYVRVLLPAVAAAGLTPVDPWVGDEIVRALELPAGPERLVALREANRVTGARNAQLIDGSAGLLAVLDGTDVDSGTAAEIGYAAALGKPVVGWRSDLRQTGDNEATVVNLQVEHFLAEVHRDLAAALSGLHRRLSDIGQ
jgi:nucleoside 2-deoxyribosyltransferase